MDITVEIKTHFGIERIYPVCDKAKSFTHLTGNLTLSRGNIDTIRQLGYNVHTRLVTL